MQQTFVFLVLGLALLLFVWGRIRHDIVALISLLALTLSGAVPSREAFAGFSHPAVIAVAAVLMVGKGLQNSGLVDVIGHGMVRIGKKPGLQAFSLLLLVSIASAFMNNVGALVILMPVAINLARKNGRSPSTVLMPLAFGSLLGGMMTMIGTPPNIIIATFRTEAAGQPFGMFDYAPVGAVLAAAGILFITFIGRHLLPTRKGENTGEDRFQIENYITEVRVTAASKLSGMTKGEVQTKLKSEVNVLGIVRNKRRMHAPRPKEKLKTNDILIIEADSEDLKTFIEKSGAKLIGDKKFRKDAEGADEITIVEAVVMQESPLIGQTAASTQMRSRYGVNLLAIARSEKHIRKRFDNEKLRAGDVLLLQGRTANLDDALTSMGCLPLADRGYALGEPRKIITALSIFGLSIVLVVSGLLAVQIAFTLAAVLMVLTGILPVRKMYDSIDWPVIILLGAMLPVGSALEHSGGAAAIADIILTADQTLPVWFTLGLILTVTMVLSGIINNAATVVLMAPIGIGTATGMNVSADPFLMAIAIGASCAFLTPIGHQSNTIVMGPGGYKFIDYLKMGIPLSLLIILISVPMILLIWPL
jgi:di/tricarboxylate transporter